MNTMSALATHPAALFLSENTMSVIARRMANHLAQDGRADEFDLAPSHERVMMVATHYIEDWYNSLSMTDLVAHLAESSLRTGLLRSQQMLSAEMHVHLLKKPNIVCAIDQHRQSWLKDPIGYDPAPFSKSCESLYAELRTDAEKCALRRWAEACPDPREPFGQAAREAMARALRLCFPSPWEWPVETLRENYGRAALIMQQVVRQDPHQHPCLLE